MKEQVSAQVFDSSKQHRLRLVFIESGNGGFNFSRLDWHIRSGTRWCLESSISRNDFQINGDIQRWISDIHSIDPKSNSCLIKVAEGEQQTTKGHLSYIYSWREWDLLSNSQTRFIKFCENIWEGPFPLEEIGYSTEQDAAANP